MKFLVRRMESQVVAGTRRDSNNRSERVRSLQVSRAMHILFISLTICLSTLSTLPEARAQHQNQLVPSQPATPKHNLPSQVNATAASSIKIRQQQRQTQFRYARDSNVAPSSSSSADANKNATNKPQIPTFKPPPLIETTTTQQAPRFGLIARTSDAIYKTLSGYFSHEDENDDVAHADERAMFGSKITTTPTPPTSAVTKMTTKWPETTTGNTRRRTTLAGGGGGVSAATTKPTSAGLATRTSSALDDSRTTLPAPHTTSVPRFTTTKLTTVPHLDLSSYTDQTTTTPRVTSKQSPSPLPPTRIPTTIKTSSSSTATPRAPETPTTRSQTSSRPPAIWTPRPPRPSAEHEPSKLNLTAPTTPAAPASQADDRIHPAPSSMTSVVSQRAEFFSFLSQAIKSIYSLNEFAYAASNRNRSTRLAPPHAPNEGELENEHESEETTIGPQASVPSDKLIQKVNSESSKQQVVGASTREDILLLCKLLHKHLESGRKNEDGSITLTLDGALAANLSSPSPAPGGVVAPTTSKPSAPQASSSRPSVDSTQGDSPLANSRLIGDPQRELSELQHEDRLLESTFALEPRQQRDNRSHEQVAEELLSTLYNLGHRRKLMVKNSTSSVSNEDETPSSAALYHEPEVMDAPHAGNISLRVWSRTTTGGGTGSRLKLVYWLLERVRMAPRRQQVRTGSSEIRYKVLDLQGAGDLLDQLDHVYVQQLIDALALVRPIVLVAAHKRGGADDEPSGQVAPPLVLDDSLAASSPPSSGPDSSQTNNNRTTLHLLVDKLTQSSFSDNLYLYSILFLLALFLLIMCFAVPALCCKCMMPASATMRPGGRRGAGRRFMDGNRRNNAGGRHRGHPEFTPSSYDNDRSSPITTPRSHFKSTDPLRESISSISGALATAKNGANNGSKQANEGAIWRKLSNSTTTLTKDQVRTLEEDDGRQAIIVPINSSDRQQPPGGRQDGNKFEWYVFEDNQTLRKTTSRSGTGDSPEDKPSQTLVVRDQRKVTKSIQTYLPGDSDRDQTGRPPVVGSPTSGHFNDSIDREGLSLAYRDRLETRNSDTLTKSELVMLKEKLIPIGRELRNQQQQQQQQKGDEQQLPHDYVNTSQTRAPSRHTMASRHIDSTSADSATGASGTGSGNGRSERYMGQPVADESQRAPSMRYLELPAGSGGGGGQPRVVLGELERAEGEEETRRGSAAASRTTAAGLRVPAGTSKLTSSDQRQQIAGDTYRRYDVI